MKIIIGNSSIELKILNNYFDKLFGLMFKKNFDYAVRLRSNGIHTMFMRDRIDVLLCDKDNKVLHVYKNLRKWRIILPKKNVYYTYEFPIGFINDIQVNDYLKIV